MSFTRREIVGCEVLSLAVRMLETDSWCSSSIVVNKGWVVGSKLVMLQYKYFLFCKSAKLNVFMDLCNLNVIFIDFYSLF